MPSPSPASLISGFVFGSALTLSGVAAPKVIREQFDFKDFHMLLTFMTASAASSAVFAIYNATNHRGLPTKRNTTYEWFGKYDGNIVGGAMLGLGMALTGACPGTVIVQAASGSTSSRLLMFSGLLSGLVFARWKSRVKQVLTSKDGPATVMEATGWSDTSTVTLYVMLSSAIVSLASIFGVRSQWPVHPVAGGLMIGLGQAASVAFAHKSIGVSSAYQDAGEWIWSLFRGADTDKLGVENLGFVGGLFAGARLTMYLIPATLDAMAAHQDLEPLTLLIGGFFLIFGARLAGGCTSGHGISGMSSMGLSSFVTVGSMFGAAIATTWVLKLFL